MHFSGPLVAFVALATCAVSRPVGPDLYGEKHVKHVLHDNAPESIEKHVQADPAEFARGIFARDPEAGNVVTRNFDQLNDKMSHSFEKAKQTISDAKDSVDKVKKDGQDALDKAEKNHQDAMDKAKKNGQDAMDKAKKNGQDAMDKAKKNGQDALDKAKKNQQDALDKAKKNQQDALDKAKNGQAFLNNSSLADLESHFFNSIPEHANGNLSMANMQEIDKHLSEILDKVPSEKRPALRSAMHAAKDKFSSQFVHGVPFSAANISKTAFAPISGKPAQIPYTSVGHVSEGVDVGKAYYSGLDAMAANPLFSGENVAAAANGTLLAANFEMMTPGMRYNVTKYFPAFYEQYGGNVSAQIAQHPTMITMWGATNKSDVLDEAYWTIKNESVQNRADYEKLYKEASTQANGNWAPLVTIGADTGHDSTQNSKALQRGGIQEKPTTIPTGTLLSLVLPPGIDPFYHPPMERYSRVQHGGFIGVREVLSVTYGFFIRTYQVNFRTQNAVGEPITGVTTFYYNQLKYDRTHMVSYQYAEDAAFDVCAPSFQASLGVSDSYIVTLLARGYAVNSPDHEGPDSTFLIGLTSARVTLDSLRALRAALDANQIPGVNSHIMENIALFGYSGGAHATGHTAENAASYAPDIARAIRGTAIGGVPANLWWVSDKINRSLFGGFLVVGLISLMRTYPAVETAWNDHILWYARPFIELGKIECQAEVAVNFAFVDLWSFYRDVKQFKQAIQPYMDAQALGSKPVQHPVYVFNSIADEVAPIYGVDDLVTSYCRRGVRVEYRRDAGLSHVEEYSFGTLDGMQWIDKALYGYVPEPCVDWQSAVANYNRS